MQTFNTIIDKKMLLKIAILCTKNDICCSFPTSSTSFRTRAALCLVYSQCDLEDAMHSSSNK